MTAPASATSAIHRHLQDAALQRLAGAAVFERGRRYFAQGRCHLTRDGADSSRWRVQGSANYRVELALQAQGLQGTCDCPYAADEEGLCKHVVAAALAWRRRLGAEADTEPGANVLPPRAAAAARRREALQAFLGTRPAGELAQRLFDWSQRDRDLMAELKLWQAREQSTTDARAWKATLAEVLRKTRDFYDWSDSRSYAARAQAVLPLLRDLTAREPASAREACVAALRRIFRVCEQADDSHGAIGDVLHAIHEVLLQALSAQPPQDEAAKLWLRTWMDLQDEDPVGLWGDQDMLDAAGPQVRRVYAMRVARDWAEWMAQGRDGTRTGAAAAVDRDVRRHQLRQRYLTDRRRAGDAAAVLEILSSEVASAREAVELAAQLEAMGREREALQQLEAGARRFQQDWRLEETLLRAYERDGCFDEVLAIRRRQVEISPDVEHYAAALAAAVRAGRDPARYREELHRWAQSRESEPVSPAWQASSRRLRQPAGPDVTVRVCWLLHDSRPQEALALAQGPDARLAEAAALALARALVAGDPAAASALVRGIFEQRMRQAQSPYGAELALVREWHGWLPPVEARALLDRLRTEYRAKRNFVAGLGKLPSV